MSHRPRVRDPVLHPRPIPSPPNHTARTGKNIENASFKLSYFLVVFDILPVFDASEAQSAVPHCWDGQRVGMEGVSILSDKVSILSSEWQNLSLFLGNIGDYILQRRHSWNTILFKHWYYCDMLFTHNSSASLMRVYWKPFLILSPGAWCQCPGSPVPRSQWRTVTDHSGRWWQSHSRAEANLGAGDFGHCVQELCCAILRWKKCSFVFK